MRRRLRGSRHDPQSSVGEGGEDPDAGGYKIYLRAAAGGLSYLIGEIHGGYPHDVLESGRVAYRAAVITGGADDEYPGFPGRFHGLADGFRNFGGAQAHIDDVRFLPGRPA